MSDQIHLIYISSSIALMTPPELEDLLHHARKKNERHGVTGMLLYNANTFMQVLEGSETDVHEIFGSILEDPRHANIVKIQEKPIKGRAFPGWHMGFRTWDNKIGGDVPGRSPVFKNDLDIRKILENRDESIAMLINFANRP